MPLYLSLEHNSLVLQSEPSCFALASSNKVDLEAPSRAFLLLKLELQGASETIYLGIIRVRRESESSVRSFLV